MIKAFLQSEQENALPAVSRTLLGSKKKVLLVKEESSTRYKLLQELNKAGVEVELAANAAIAMNKINEVLVDAILVDSSLSDMKGADLVKQIRKKPGFGDIPYFICSSNEADSWPGRGSQSGLTKFFFKAATPVEDIVADVVTRLGVPPKRQVGAPADNTAAHGRSLAVPDNMPDEIKNFQFVKQSPGQPKTQHTSRQQARPSNDSNADTQRKYWESKVEELSVENIKLQRQLLEAGQGEQFKIAAEKAEAACQAQAERAGQLEQELVLVRQAYEQLSGKVDEEQRAATELRRRNESLQQELSRTSVEAMHFKSELENRVAGEGSLQSELSAQLIAARAEAASAEAACRQQSERAARFESELARLREMRAELESRATQEQQAAIQARQRSDELARKLAAATQDAHRHKTELDEQLAQRASIEMQLRQQLEEAKAAAERAEADLERRTAVFSTSRQKVTALRRGRDELNTRLIAEQRKSTEVTRQSRVLENKLRETVKELAALKAQASKHQGERESWAKDLEAHKAVVQKAQAGQREEVVRAKDQLAALQRTHAELNAKLTAEQQAVVEARRHGAELEGQLRQRANEIASLKAELKQQQAERAALAKEAETTKAAIERAQAGYREEAARAKDEVKAVRQTHEELNRKLAAEQQAAAEVRRHSKEFEEKLREKLAEVARFKTEMEQHNRERSSLKEQLDAAKAAAENAQRAFARCNDELTAACRAQDELNSRLSAEQNSAAEAHRHKQELENRLRESANELNGFKAQAEQNRNQRDSLATELESARGALEQAQGALREQGGRWNEELAASRRAVDELNAKFATEQNSAAEFERRNRELEEKLHHTVNERESLLKELNSAKVIGEKAQAACAEQSAELARANEQLAALRSTREELHAKVIADRQAAAETARQKHQLEDKLREALTELASVKGDVRERTSLVKQLEVARSLVKKAQASCRKEEARGNRFGKQVAILRKARTDLSARLEKEQTAAAESKRRVKQLEVRLAKAEVGSRKRGAQVIVAQPGNFSDVDSRVRDCVGALARATADLEQERRRLEATALSSGHSSIDAARIGRAFVNSFRSQMRMPSENLMQSIRQLLESPMEGEQKKLVESALESALVLQASLQEEPNPDNQAAA